MEIALSCLNFLLKLFILMGQHFAKKMICTTIRLLVRQIHAQSGIIDKLSVVSELILEEITYLDQGVHKK